MKEKVGIAGHNVAKYYSLQQAVKMSRYRSLININLSSCNKCGKYDSRNFELWQKRRVYHLVGLMGKLVSQFISCCAELKFLMLNLKTSRKGISFIKTRK